LFTSSRALNATGSTLYQIPVGQQVNMVFAFNPNYWKLSNHQNNYGDFSIQLEPSGACTVGGLRRA